MDDFKTVKDFIGKSIFQLWKYGDKYYIKLKEVDGEVMWAIGIKDGGVEAIHPFDFIDIIIEDGKTLDDLPSPLPTKELEEEFKQFLLSFE